ncbi:MAG: hypothetical protein M3348_06220 [Acidobacteriota bacterium]|nr:hypothetical protein [Acidobacteriota bacterium]
MPKVLQRKTASPRQPQSAAPARQPFAPAAPRTQPVPKVLQREAAAARPRAHAPAAQTARSSAAAERPVVQRRAASGPSSARVIQAAKFYPNLHPGAVERIEPASLFRLESFTDQYRLRKSDSHGVYVPNQLYNFVRTAEGATLLHNRYRHPSIAEGRQVLYAGEAFFNNGRLEWWSNGSGHYQPDAEDAAQAALPLDNFYTYQQVIKGEHKRRR